jgi:hypothetical protein
MTIHRRRTARWLLPITAALLALTIATAAPAQTQRAGTTRSALATERYYSSYANDPGHSDGALAAERYYSSYGTPLPLAASVTQATTTAGHGLGWTAALLAGSLAMLAAAGLGVLAGRASKRPRHARA